ncbi:MAG: hypothetical protein ACYTBZ_26370 [Planctomycetota bacterium]|jgi:hypothetical protein
MAQSSGRVLFHSEPFVQANQMNLFDHFEMADAKDHWNTVEVGGSTITVLTSGTGGVAQFVPDTDLNDECYLYSNEMFTFQYDRPWACLASFTLNKIGGTANAEALYFGLADNIAADLILDGGADIKATYTGAGWFKPTGSRTWYCLSSHTSTTVRNSDPTQHKTQSTGSKRITLGITGNPVHETETHISFWIDELGGMGLESAHREDRNIAVKQYNRFDAGERMALCFCVKNGVDFASNTVNLDYIGGKFVHSTRDT